MDYTQASQYLDRCLIFGIKPSLTRIQKMVELMDDVHKCCRFIHVVGTNGKTSVTKMAAAILWGQGVSCGYHVSPHIHSYRERFWYNGRNITAQEFLNLFDLVYPVVQQVNKLDLGGPVTQFEIIAAMGFVMAREMGLEAMVLEAGMGGRWDATNVAHAEAVGLTGVSLEHTQFLGNTIEEIANEKVQVIKIGAHAATLSQDKRVLEIMKQKIKQQQGKLYVYGKEFEVANADSRQFLGWKVDIRGIMDNYHAVSLPLLGQYQPKNLSLALALAELFRGRAAEGKRLEKSMANIRVGGRFELIRKDPMVVADASHNPEGMQWLAKNLEDYYPKGRKIIIFAVLKDKDFRTMIEQVVGLAHILIITSTGTERSLDIDLLEKEVLAARVMPGPEQIYKMDSIKNSLNYALKICKSSDMICITGSITNLEHIVS